MAEPILFGSTLAEKKIIREYIRPYMAGQEWSSFMGGMDQVVNVIDSPGKGRGDRILIPIINSLSIDNFKRGSEQVEGTGEDPSFLNDEIVLDMVRYAAKLENVQITEQRTPIDVFGSLSPLLMDAFQRRLCRDITLTAAVPYATNVANSMPVVQRTLLGDSVAYNNSVNVALQGVTDTAANYLTVKHILKLRDLAVTGGIKSTEAERKIRPTKITHRNGMKSEHFVLFTPTRAYRHLTDDARWQAQQQRGTIENSDQPSILNGSRYKGTIENVMIYEMPELDFISYTVSNERGGASNSNVDVAHSLFCGAQAFGVCFAGTPFFSVENYDHKRIYELAKTEMRGQKVIKFKGLYSTNTTRDVENGIIHSFTAMK